MLPPVLFESKKRLEEVRKIYGRAESVSYKNSMPSTSQDLPNFIERGRSVDETRGKRLISRGRLSSGYKYGRSSSRERIDDMQEELLKAKKVNTQLQLDNRILQTKLHKLSREAARRETHLQMLMTNRFQPAELNDTQMAMTFASIKQREIELEQTVEAQSVAIDELHNQLVALSNGEITVDQIKAPSIDESNHSQELVKNTKRKIELAKQYMEQNSKLKERLRQMKTELATLRRIKRHSHSESDANTIIPNGKLANSSVLSEHYEEDELVEVIRRLKVEKETTERKFRKQIQNLVEKIEQTTGQLHHLRDENDHLREIIDQLQKDTENLRKVLENPNHVYKPVDIPKLDMSHIDSLDSAPTPYSNEFDDQEGVEYEIDDEVIATVLYETASSHIARSLVLSEAWENKEPIIAEQTELEVDSPERVDISN
ncbi:hypothetical protein WR25_01522 [Diploscapter pachys]|uniref:Lebercilin domain-containing protein n=1 Tax=Diploscapter pachys TaxID=2018661 RepID=A0A2A2J221_9BILA|nr:hypothetical protein WR25_01522 [Diploscapter pachys]